jgi:type VI protein secretion system component VasK
MSREEDNWHLSRSVPITLIFGLIAQAAAIVWTVSMMMSDIERNGEEIMRLQSRMSIVEDATQRQAVSMARIDENIKAIRQSVEKMANDQ